MPYAHADFENVPTVVFSHPTVASVGLSESEAKKKYGNDAIKTYSTTFINMYYGPLEISAENKPKTVMKLVTLLPNEKILGIHMMGN